MNQTIKLEGIKGFQQEKTKGVSPWMLSLEQELGPERPAARWSYTLQDFEFNVFEGEQSLWIVIRFPKGGEVALRAAYCPYNHIVITNMRRRDDGLENVFDQVLEIELSSVTGDYHVRLEMPARRPRPPPLHHNFDPGSPALCPLLSSVTSSRSGRWRI